MHQLIPSDICPDGKYRGVRLSDIPPAWLRISYDLGLVKNKELRTYIKNYIIEAVEIHKAAK